MKSAFINLYVSGFFHRLDKPNQFNAHPGDLYPTRELAVLDIAPADCYLGTVEVLIPDDLYARLGKPNGPDAKPIPLEDSRRAYHEFGGGDALRVLAFGCL